MTDAQAPELAGARPKPPKQRLDKWLNWILGITVAAVVLFAGNFAWNVYSLRLAEQEASPALRVVSALKKQVKKEPNNPTLRSRLAEGLAAAGMLEEAEKQLKTAVKIDPKFVGGYQNLGMVAMGQKDYATATKAFEKVLELTKEGNFQQINQRREAAYFYLGEIALNNRRYDEAIGFFKAALRIRKDASDTYVRLAQAFSGIDQPEPAIEQLEIALKFDPGFPEAHYEYGKILLAKGDKAGAAEHFRAAADGAPDVDEPQQALEQLGGAEDWIAQAKSAAANKDLETALTAARIAVALDPENIGSGLFLGKTAMTAGDKKTALKAYEAVLKIDPDQVVAKKAVETLNKKPKKGDAS